MEAAASYLAKNDAAASWRIPGIHQSPSGYQCALV